LSVRLSTNGLPWGPACFSLLTPSSLAPPTQGRADPDPLARLLQIYLARVQGDFSKMDFCAEARAFALPAAGEAKGGGQGGEGEEGDEEVLFDSWYKGDLAALEDGKGGGMTDYWLQSDNSVRVRCPIRCVSAREGLHDCHPDGKPAVTVLRPLPGSAYDPVSDTSLVECRPITGRTHQIRLHLQWLGYPIANDPNYGHEKYVRDFRDEFPHLPRYDDNQAQAEGGGGAGPEGAGADVAVAPGPSTPAQAEAEAGARSGGGGEGDDLDARIVRACRYCRPGGDGLFKPEQLRHTGIWLHALHYQGPGWAYRTRAPAWARELMTGGDPEGQGGGGDVVPPREGDDAVPRGAEAGKDGGDSASDGKDEERGDAVS
jgi:hypothetical protein